MLFGLDLTSLTILTGTFGAGLAVTAYPGFAGVNGWPVGRSMLHANSWPRILGIFNLLGAPIVTIAVMPWLALPLVLIGGIILAYATVEALRNWAQFVAIGASIVGFVLTCVLIL